jgi:hypothetical protein
MKKRLLVAAILLLSFVILTSYPVSAQESVAGDNPSVLATGSGGLRTANFFSETGQVGNDSIDIWVNAFNQEVTLGGAGSQCIEMRYSGEVKVFGGPPPLRMQFRAMVDGVLAKGGAPFFDAIDRDIYTTAAMNWWACGLTPGTHTVKIQFGPYFSDLVSRVRNRTLIIEYDQ